MVSPASRAPYHSAFPLWCACKNQGTELGQGKCPGSQGDAQSLPVPPACMTSTWLQASVSLLGKCARHRLELTWLLGKSRNGGPSLAGLTPPRLPR